MGLLVASRDMVTAHNPTLHASQLTSSESVLLLPALPRTEFLACVLRVALANRVQHRLAQGKGL